MAAGSDAAKALEDRVRGEVIRPGDDAYDAARAIWNARADHRPSLIVRCAGVADVMDALAYARQTGQPVSVRGGGHHTTGQAVSDGGLMIDLSSMNGVRVDPAARTVHVGPGARVRDVDHEAQRFGLMTTGAPVSTVGMAGYTLGGGLGWTSRLHGLACDNLIAADVVTADGELVRASEDENADLFWALRGGSGNFGIVTSFEFRLHPLGPGVLAGPIVHPLSAAASVLRFWRDFMADAADALQCMPVVFALPPEPGSGLEQGDTVIALFPLWASDPAEGERVMAPLREFGAPLSDGVAVAPYSTLLSALDEMYRAGDRIYYRSLFFDALPDEAIDVLVERMAPVPSPYSSLFLEPLGGAIARRRPDETAFPHRQRRWCVTASPKWADAARDDDMIAWADRLFDGLQPHAADGVYVNYLDDVGGIGDAGDAARLAYGANEQRLREIKRRYDPDNVFRSNHNIVPEPRR